MSEKRIVVPDGMQIAFDQAMNCGEDTDSCLETSLRWLSENPIVPTDEDVEKMMFGMTGLESFGRLALKTGAIQWQCRMFLAPEPEIPEAVKDMLAEEIQYPSIPLTLSRQKYNADILEAYRRGQKAGK